MSEHGHHGPHETEEELRHDLAFERATLDESIAHDYSTADTGIVPLDRRRPMWHFMGLWTTFVAGFSYMFLGFEMAADDHYQRLLFRDEDEGETAYQFQMAILDYDLKF